MDELAVLITTSNPFIPVNRERSKSEGLVTLEISSVGFKTASIPEHCGEPPVQEDEGH